MFVILRDVTKYSVVGIYWHHLQLCSKQVAWTFDLEGRGITCSETTASFFRLTRRLIPDSTVHVDRYLASLRRQCMSPQMPVLCIAGTVDFGRWISDA
jgi:hypothetical protein